MTDTTRLAELDKAIVEKDEAILSRVEAFETEIAAELESIRSLVAEANRVQEAITGHPCAHLRGALAMTVAGRAIWGPDALPQLAEAIKAHRRRQASALWETEHAAEIAASREKAKREAAERDARAAERMSDPKWLALFAERLRR